MAVKSVADRAAIAASGAANNDTINIIAMIAKRGK